MLKESVTLSETMAELIEKNSDKEFFWPQNNIIPTHQSIALAAQNLGFSNYVPDQLNTAQALVHGYISTDPHNNVVARESHISRLTQTSRGLHRKCILYFAELMRWGSNLYSEESSLSDWDSDLNAFPVIRQEQVWGYIGESTEATRIVVKNSGKAYFQTKSSGVAGSLFFNFDPQDLNEDTTSWEKILDTFIVDNRHFIQEPILNLIQEKLQSLSGKNAIDFIESVLKLPLPTGRRILHEYGTTLFFNQTTPEDAFNKLINPLKIRLNHNNKISETYDLGFFIHIAGITTLSPLPEEVKSIDIDLCDVFGVPGQATMLIAKITYPHVEGSNPIDYLGGMAEWTAEGSMSGSHSLYLQNLAILNLLYPYGYKKLGYLNTCDRREYYEILRMKGQKEASKYILSKIKQYAPDYYPAAKRSVKRASLNQMYLQRQENTQRGYPLAGFSQYSFMTQINRQLPFTVSTTAPIIEPGAWQSFFSQLQNNKQATHRNIRIDITKTINSEQMVVYAEMIENRLADAFAKLYGAETGTGGVMAGGSASNIWALWQAHHILEKEMQIQPRACCVLFTTDHAHYSLIRSAGITKNMKTVLVTTKTQEQPDWGSIDPESLSFFINQEKMYLQAHDLTLFPIVSLTEGTTVLGSIDSHEAVQEVLISHGYQLGINCIILQDCANQGPFLNQLAQEAGRKPYINLSTPGTPMIPTSLHKTFGMREVASFAVFPKTQYDLGIVDPVTKKRNLTSALKLGLMLAAIDNHDWGAALKSLSRELGARSCVNASNYQKVLLDNYSKIEDHEVRNFMLRSVRRWQDPDYPQIQSTIVASAQIPDPNYRPWAIENHIPESTGRGYGYEIERIEDLIQTQAPYPGLYGGIKKGQGMKIFHLVAMGSDVTQSDMLKDETWMYESWKSFCNQIENLIHSFNQRINSNKKGWELVRSTVMDEIYELNPKFFPEYEKNGTIKNNLYVMANQQIFKAMGKQAAVLLGSAFTHQQFGEAATLAVEKYGNNLFSTGRLHSDFFLPIYSIHGADYSETICSASGIGWPIKKSSMAKQIEAMTYDVLHQYIGDINSTVFTLSPEGIMASAFIGSSSYHKPHLNGFLLPGVFPFLFNNYYSELFQESLERNERNNPMYFVGYGFMAGANFHHQELPNGSSRISDIAKLHMLLQILIGSTTYKCEAMGEISWGLIKRRLKIDDKPETNLYHQYASFIQEHSIPDVFFHNNYSRYFPWKEQHYSVFRELIPQMNYLRAVENDNIGGPRIIFYPYGPFLTELINSRLKRTATYNQYIETELQKNHISITSSPNKASGFNFNYYKHGNFLGEAYYQKEDGQTAQIFCEFKPNLTANEKELFQSVVLAKMYSEYIHHFRKEGESNVFHLNSYLKNIFDLQSH